MGNSQVADFDVQVRIHVYDEIITSCRFPSIRDVVRAVGAEESTVRDAFHVLLDRASVVLTYGDSPFAQGVFLNQASSTSFADLPTAHISSEDNATTPTNDWMCEVKSELGIVLQLLPSQC